MSKIKKNFDIKVASWLLNTELENYHFDFIIKTHLNNDFSFTQLMQKRLNKSNENNNNKNNNLNNTNNNINNNQNNNNNNKNNKNNNNNNQISLLVHNMIISFRLFSILKNKLEREKLIMGFKNEMKVIGPLSKMEFFGINLDISLIDHFRNLLKERKKKLLKEASDLLGRKIILSSPADVGLFFYYLFLFI